MCADRANDRDPQRRNEGFDKMRPDDRRKKLLMRPDRQLQVRKGSCKARCCILGWDEDPSRFFQKRPIGVAPNLWIDEIFAFMIRSYAGPADIYCRKVAKETFRGHGLIAVAQRREIMERAIIRHATLFKRGHEL